jgi:hypothetical protein
MATQIDWVRQISKVPSETTEFNQWLEAGDALKFLDDSVADRELILYAAMSHAYMHAVFVPLSKLDPADKEDLMEWNFSPSSSWGISYNFGTPREISISPPMESTGSKTIDAGEQVIFLRHFEGRMGQKNYVELLQKFIHCFELHFIEERNAFCRLDSRGDLEDVIEITEAKENLIVTCERELVDQYATITDSAVVRMFDFTRWRTSNFNGWSGSTPSFVDSGNIFYRQQIESGHASYIRGCQVLYSPLSKDEVVERQESIYQDKDRKYESYIAHDFKNGVVREISTEPGKTTNYFTESELPFETSPAFFRPDVLIKYKSDSEKYRLADRSITCRGAWYLKTYDTNEAGQVHTYIVYLRGLPHEEQLHWKAYNE